MAFVHQGKKQPDLYRLDLDVAYLVDQEAIEVEIAFDELVLGVVGHGLVELGEQLGKQDVSAGKALVDGVNQKACGQAGFAASGRSEPDDVLIFCNRSWGSKAETA